MIRKDYLIESAAAQKQGVELPNMKMKQEIMDLIDKAFSGGAIVEIKILEGDTQNGDGKSFSKLRFDITSNTGFDQFHN